MASLASKKGSAKRSMTASSSITNKPPVVVRRRRSPMEILGIGNDSTATTNDSSSLELHRTNLNVSAGGKFYERAKSRRQRHRQVLMDREDDTLIPLGGSKRTRSITTNEEEHDDQVEQEYEQKGKLRALKLHDKMRPSRRKVVAPPTSRGARSGAPGSKRRGSTIKEVPVRKPNTTVATGKRRRAS